MSDSNHADAASPAGDGDPRPSAEPGDPQAEPVRPPADPPLGEDNPDDEEWVLL